jgi:serine/threonine protein kinase
MTLLRAVDGTGHVGVATTGFFGSMIFWPLAELEAAVTASRLPDRRDPGAKYAMSGGGTDTEQHAKRALPFTDAPVDAEALRKLAKGDKNKGLLNSKTSSLGQDTALISFTEIRLKKCVGEGSFGRVYCAVWANHTEVAVKMLGPPSAFQGNKDPLEKQRGRPTMAVGAKADAAETAAAGRAAAEGRNKSVAATAASIHKDDGALSSADNSSDNESQDDEPEPQPEDEHVDAETLDELEKEVGIMARLRHPNIVLLLGVVRSPPAIVEEYCARGSLFSVLQRHIKSGVPALEWRVRLQMALGAAAGMCYLHNCSPPVIHRDLKSPNLMVDRYFRVKVGDFNLSRVAVAAAGGRGSTSGATSVNPETSQGALHSPRWMAPEVLRAAKYTKASDVYSFGIVLWEIRTLKIPWASSGQWQVMHAVVEEGRRPDLDVAPNPSFEWIGEYDQLIEDAWTQEPAKRPKFERIITRLQSFIDKIAVTHSGRRREVESRGTNEGSSTEVSAADGARNVGDAKPPVPPFHGTAAVPKEQNKFETPLDPNVVSLTLAEAPEGGNSVGVDDHDHGNENASGAEAERAVLRILSRKRSLKLDNVAVPKGLTLRTDAAVADLRASQEWASPTKPRKPPFAPRGSTTAAAAAVAAAAASGAAVAAFEVETALAKPGRGEPLKAMSSGTSLARFQSFVSSVSKRQAFTNHPPRPQTASGRFSSVRASADAVMQSPPREGTQPVERTRPATARQSTAAPRQSSPTSAMSPMLRAIAARKTLAPLDLHGGGFGGSGSGSASSLASSGGHRRTKTLH